jgi:hypothetical protein
MWRGTEGDVCRDVAESDDVAAVHHRTQTVDVICLSTKQVTWTKQSLKNTCRVDAWVILQ